MAYMTVVTSEGTHILGINDKWDHVIQLTPEPVEKIKITDNNVAYFYLLNQIISATWTS